MKTRIVIEVYNIKWDVKSIVFEGKFPKVPKKMTVDIPVLVFSKHIVDDGQMGLEELLFNMVESKQGWSMESARWRFV